MLGRSKSTAPGKDLRSRIKHENSRLGAGTDGAPPPSAGSNATPGGSAGGGMASYGSYGSLAGSAGGGMPNLGSGPSFVSLSPSDSISNYEGRPGPGGRIEPSAASTASFAQSMPYHPSPLSASHTVGAMAASHQLQQQQQQQQPPHSADATTPLRPARSQRRPQQAPTPVDPSMGPPSRSRTPALAVPERSASRAAGASGSNTPRGAGRDLLAASRAAQQQQQHYGSVDGTSSADRHARSAQLMAQAGDPGGRRTPGGGSDEEDFDDDDYDGDGRGGGYQVGSLQAQGHQPLGQLSKPEAPNAMATVLSALSAAGKKQQAMRMLKGTTAEEESRRRRTERKFEDAKRRRDPRPVEAYVDRNDARVFREINAVLRKVTTEWGFICDDDFNPVSLALSLMDDSSLGSSRAEFQEMQAQIERALQGTVDDHYESFAGAITLHNSVLASLTAAQSSISNARRRLRGSREALGVKRADLVQLWHRSQGVKESIRILDTVEQLKAVPDRLEQLMSEKRFLHAVNLLTRSIKTIEKPDVLEIGAVADLRTYLKSQEQGMFDILIEELHNHLYLKSFFCDSRWKAYSAGQDRLPNVDFGAEYEVPAEATAGGAPPATAESRVGAQDMGVSPSQQSQAERPLKLQRFITALSARPSFDPSLATDLADLSMSRTTSALTGEAMVPSRSTEQNLAQMAAGGSSMGPNETLGLGTADEYEQNPEADSFLYIEMLLESLARLGKLGFALDVIHSRLTVELHQLVDATIDEVDQRNEPLRRSSMALRPESLILASSLAFGRNSTDSLGGGQGANRSSTRSSLGSALNALGGVRASSTMLQLSVAESSQVERESETMRDLFWTLFSKLDAVLQGHRVVFEVVSRIRSRASAKGQSIGDAIRRNHRLPNLAEVWRPIQNEVRGLLHEHLMDDSQSPSARRNAVVSINDVLRANGVGRDRGKRLFKLGEQKVGVASSRKDFGVLKRHEEAITAALRASVPGLVSAAEAGQASSTAAQLQASSAVIVSASRPVESSAAGAGHRLLVKPDAFNVSVLFQPALAFIDRVQEVMPGGVGVGDEAGSGKGFSAFLDEFVQDVFLPQLEDKVQNLFQAAVTGPDAFQEDPSQRALSPRPVVKSAANVVVLIDSLYSMLTTTPFHRESYSHLIIQTIVQYYQRCSERFRDLVAVEAANDVAAAPTSEVKLAANWARRPELSACMSSQLRPDLEPSKRRQLMRQENDFEIHFAAATNKPANTIVRPDLITSRKKLIALGNLQHSLRWLLSHISRLQATEGGIPMSRQAKARLSVIGVPRDKVEEDKLKLPLSHDMAERYAAIPRAYESLANTILYTLRLELRARVIHYLDLAISEGNYLVEDAALEPDPHIVDLNAELASLDDVFADSVAGEQHRFLFSGLASLMDQLLCSAVRRVRAVNRQGVTKMIRNILALQQNLRNIVIVDTSALTGAEAGAGGASGAVGSKPASMAAQMSGMGSEEGDNFDRSRRLWELLAKEPNTMLSTIRSIPAHLRVGFDDYRCALNLMLGLDNSPVSGGKAKPQSPRTPQTGGFADRMASVAAAAGLRSPPSANGKGGGGGGATASPAATTAEGEATTPLTAKAGGQHSNIKPGTTNMDKGVSRQLLNELLIELHDVIGESETDAE